ncbi:unnamed protein product [Thlaspi arvense]|uniref:Uncharacterized protein n=1 Tax=Thlaspi arvense TaxID=13288 RepID=A0AAU9SJX6_THLAR|nr:unnamed protein product [Thlaspi arvense]
MVSTLSFIALLERNDVVLVDTNHSGLHADGVDIFVDCYPTSKKEAALHFKASHFLSILLLLYAFDTCVDNFLFACMYSLLSAHYVLFHKYVPARRGLGLSFSVEQSCLSPDQQIS